MTIGTASARLVRRTVKERQAAGTMQSVQGRSDGQGGKEIPLRDLLSDPHDRVLRAAVVAALTQATGTEIRRLFFRTPCARRLVLVQPLWVGKQELT